MATEIGLVDVTRAWEARQALSDSQRKHLEAWVRVARIEAPARVGVAIQRGLDAWAESQAREAAQARQEIERLRRELAAARANPNHQAGDDSATEPASDDEEVRTGLRKLVRW